MSGTTDRVNHRVIYVVLGSAVVAFALLQSLVTPVLSSIATATQTSQSSVTWVLTTYLLSASVFTPIMGRLGDMYGKKRIFLITLGALALGSLIAALASSLPIMLVGRAVQGIGGGVLPLTFGVIRDEFPGDKVTGAIGLTAALAAVGTGLGVTLAGPIVAWLGIDWLYWVPLGLIVLVGIAAFVLVPESRSRAAGKVNVLNAVLLSVWLLALLLAVSQGPVWGWTSVVTIAMLASSVVLFGIWALAERKSRNPLIDMRLMRLRPVWAANLVALLMGIGMYALLAFLPQFLQTSPGLGYGFGVSVTQAGLILLPNTACMFVVGLVIGKLARRFDSRNLLATGAVVCATGYWALALLHHSEVFIYIAMAIVGIGSGLVFSSLANVVVAAVPPEQTGVASGVNVNIRTVGGSIGATLMATVVGIGASADGVPVESGYTIGFAILGLAVAAAAVAATLIPTSGRSRVDGASQSLGVVKSPG